MPLHWVVNRRAPYLRLPSIFTEPFPTHPVRPSLGHILRAIGRLYGGQTAHIYYR